MFLVQVIVYFRYVLFLGGNKPGVFFLMGEDGWGVGGATRRFSILVGSLEGCL